MPATEQSPQQRYAHAVHALANLVPEGSVLSYGDIAELLGSGGARQVGKAMQTSPPGTPWWRIVRADGSMTSALEPIAVGHWVEEQLTYVGQKIPMKTKRWQPDEAAWQRIDELRIELGNAKLSEVDDQL